MAMEDEEEEEETGASPEPTARLPSSDAEALQHKSLAEHHYLRSDLKSAVSHAKKALRLAPSLPGLPQLLAALRILRASPLDPFRVLSLTPSSPLPAARRRFRSLSLLLRSTPSLVCSTDALLRLRSALRLLSRTPTEPTLAQMQLQALRSRRSSLSSGKKRRLPKEEPRDFHDFNADRAPGSFRKGQVWALYDDHDRVPCRYALVHEVLSANPFQLKLSFLAPHSRGEEEDGAHVSCGRFRVGREVEVEPAGLFSHLVICEREAREVYGIYPSKGSVWVVHHSPEQCRGQRKGLLDLVVVLMGYSEMYGMSVAYLEKVEGFRAVFRRKEVGLHAVNWMGKDGLASFSHQVPARKLVGEEWSSLPGQCWELDAASLPGSLLQRRHK